MKNKSLAFDYVSRAEKRLHALAALMQVSAWADVVRESQEVVELALKGLLREHGVEIPRIHDVSDVLSNEISRFPEELQAQVPELSKISRSLRRDRELAFYGSEDLTPSEFYKEDDAKIAFEQAKALVAAVLPFVRP